MPNNSKNKLLIMLISFVLLINVWTLTSHVINRQAERSLVLTQRELPISSGAISDENSGMSLKLKYSVHKPGTEFVHHLRPAWLDKNKMSELGFTNEELTGNRDFAPRVSKVVFWVLEFDGLAYQNYLQDVKTQLRSQMLDGGRDVNWLNKKLQGIHGEQSRLFVVDVGSDLKTLKQKYPKENKYLIVEGLVSTPWYQLNKNDGYGVLDGLLVSKIHLPLHLNRPLLTHLDKSKSELKLQYDVRLNYGKLGWPWLSDLEIL